MKRLATIFAASILLTCIGLADSDPFCHLLDRYGSIPKGVVLEGEGATFGDIERVAYDAEANTFELNDTWTYANPVSREAFGRLLKAIRADDRVGMSYTTDRRVIVYGTLSDKDSIVQDLFATDVFLGGVVYGRKKYIGDRELPGDYQPVRVGKQEVMTASSFSFEQYVFQRDPDKKRITRKRSAFVIRIIPISNERAADGGHLPDMALFDDGKGFGKTYGKECKPNVDHIEQHKEAYLAMPVVDKARRYGEAGAFIRRLKSAEIDLDALQKDVLPQKKGFLQRVFD